MTRAEWRQAWALARVLWFRESVGRQAMSGRTAVRTMIAKSPACRCLCARSGRNMPLRAVVEMHNLWISMMEDQPYWRRSRYKREEYHESIVGQMRSNMCWGRPEPDRSGWPGPQTTTSTPLLDPIRYKTITAAPSPSLVTPVLAHRAANTPAMNRAIEGQIIDAARAS